METSGEIGQGDILFAPAGGSSHYRARGRYLWRKDASPLDPHQKHGGRHRPPYPLWAQRQGPRPPPLETTPPKDRERQRKKKQMVSSLQPDKRHTRRCEDAVIQGTSVSAAGRRLLDFVGSAYRPLLRMGELTACGQLIPNIFSFPPYTAHFLFDVSKRKWGVYSDRQSLHPCGGSLHPDRNVPLLEAKKILGTFLTAKP